MAMIKKCEVLEASLLTFMEEVKGLWNDGWEIDPDVPPHMFAFQYKVGMVKEVFSEEELVQKETRAEILARARAAKAARKAEARQQ